MALLLGQTQNWKKAISLVLVRMWLKSWQHVVRFLPFGSKMLTTSNTDPSLNHNPGLALQSNPQIIAKAWIWIWIPLPQAISANIDMGAKYNFPVLLKTIKHVYFSKINVMIDINKRAAFLGAVICSYTVLESQPPDKAQTCRQRVCYHSL